MWVEEEEIILVTQKKERRKEVLFVFSNVTHMTLKKAIYFLILGCCIWEHRSCVRPEGCAPHWWTNKMYCTKMLFILKQTISNICNKYQILRLVILLTGLEHQGMVTPLVAKVCFSASDNKLSLGSRSVVKKELFLCTSYPPEFEISDVVIRTLVFGNSSLEAENLHEG